MCWECGVETESPSRNRPVGRMGLMSEGRAGKTGLGGLSHRPVGLLSWGESCLEEHSARACVFLHRTPPETRESLLGQAMCWKGRWLVGRVEYEGSHGGWGNHVELEPECPWTNSCRETRERERERVLCFGTNPSGWAALAVSAGTTRVHP